MGQIFIPALIATLAISLAGCGSGSSTATGQNFDLGTGGKTDFGATVGDMAVVPYDPPFPPVAPQVLRGSNVILATPRVIPVFWSGDTLRTELTTFVQSYMTRSSSWQVLKEYGIGFGTVATALVMTQAPAATTSDADIRTLLASLIQAGTLPRPDASTVYLMFFPSGVSITQGSGTSCTDFAGYHSDTTLSDGTHAPYAVIPRCQRSTLASLTFATSHELAEAATDPQLSSYNDLNDPYALWFIPFNGPEVGDLCENITDAAYTESGVGVVSRLWSNVASAAFQNPCLPAPAGPLFHSIVRLPELRTVLLDNKLRSVELVSIVAGQSKTLEVRSFGDSKAGLTWTVRAEEMPFGSTTGGAASPVLSFAWQESAGQSATTQNGGTLHLKITASAQAPAVYTTFRLTATGPTNTTAQTQTQWAGTVSVTR